MDKELQKIYKFAFRHALNGSSTAQMVVIEQIEKVMEEMGTAHLVDMIADIEHAVKHELLDGCAKEMWMEFAEELKQEVNKR